MGWDTFGEFAVCIGETEINDFDVFFVIKQHVFWLKIAVHYSKPMQIVDSINYLMEEATCLPFSQSNSKDEYFFCSAI